MESTQGWLEVLVAVVGAPAVGVALPVASAAALPKDPELEVGGVWVAGAVVSLVAAANLANKHCHQKPTQICQEQEGTSSTVHY